MLQNTVSYVKARVGVLTRVYSVLLLLQKKKTLLMMMKITYPSYTNQFDNVILSNACYMYMCSHLKGEGGKKRSRNELRM